MSDHVYKKIELVGSSPNSIEEAVANALARAQKTIRNMRWFEVVETRGHIEDGKINHWQVTVKVGFTLDNRLSDASTCRPRVRRSDARHGDSRLRVTATIVVVLRGLIELGRAVNQDRRLERDHEQPHESAKDAADRQAIENEPGERPRRRSIAPDSRARNLPSARGPARIDLSCSEGSAPRRPRTFLKTVRPCYLNFASRRSFACPKFVNAT